VNILLRGKLLTKPFFGSRFRRLRSYNVDFVGTFNRVGKHFDKIWHNFKKALGNNRALPLSVAAVLYLACRKTANHRLMPCKHSSAAVD
jgi:hypothetical protein